MEICPHLPGISLNKQLSKFSQGRIKDQIETSTLFCDACSISLPSLWLCLNDNCNFVGCGRYQNKHSMMHFQNSKHPLYINPRSCMIWCLDCDTEIIDGENEYQEKLRGIRAIFSKQEEENGNKLNGNSEIKGKIGLKNLGNTCYMNSVLQCLSNIRAIQRYFRKVFVAEDFKDSEVPDFVLVAKFADLVRQLWSGASNSYSPRDFLSSLHRSCPFFKGMGQHDSQEFLRIFLDKVHESLKHQYRNTEYRSIISDTFKSSIESKVTCLICGTSYTKNEDYYDLALQIPSQQESEDFRKYDSQLLSPAERVKFNTEKQNMWRKISKVFSGDSVVTLYDCILNFCLPEQLKGDDKFMCENCGKKTKSQREFKILNPPNVLVLVVKRFKFMGIGSKVSTYIKFPKELDLRYFLQKPKSCVYHLNGMVQHFGGVGGGHYISYCHNYRTNIWHEFDDSRVRQVPESYVLDQEAYILFYQKSMPGLREKATSQEPCMYIPTYWLNKYYTLSDPGEIYQKYLLCPHMKLKPIYGAAEYTRMNANQVLNFMSNYNSDTGSPEVVQKCDRCEQEFYKIDNRIEKEFELMTNLNSIKPFEGPWYVISTEWLNKWKRFCSHDIGEDNGFPGPVDNSVLFDGNQAKKGLEKPKHYRGVNRHVWYTFMEIYGGGPTICRQILDIYSAPSPEIKCSTPNISEETMQSIRAIKKV